MEKEYVEMKVDIVEFVVNEMVGIVEFVENEKVELDVAQIGLN